MGPFVVICDTDGEVFGPFDTEQDARDWIAAEGTEHGHDVRRLVEPE